MSREGFLDVLVEAGLFGSRSEAAAFLIGVGVDAQHEVFERVGEHSEEIKKIRQSLKQDVEQTISCVLPWRLRFVSSGAWQRIIKQFAENEMGKIRRRTLCPKLSANSRNSR